MTYQRTPGILPYSDAIPVNRYRVPRGGAITTRGLVQDTEYCAPIACAPGQVLDRIALEVTTLGAGGTIRVGVRQDSAGLPTTAVIEVGTLDPTSTGTKELTGLTITATGPRVWISVVCQGSGAVVVRGIFGQVIGADLGTNAAATAVTACFTQTGVSGAFPTTVPTGQSNPAPNVAVRAIS